MTTWEPEIEPRTARYYERETLEGAVIQAMELIAEWDYAEDPHGYCHTRPMLVCMVEAIRTAGLVGDVKVSWEQP